MNFTLTTIRLPEFNRHSLTERDFYDICEREGVTLIEKYQSNCFYMTIDGAPFIVIGTRKRGLKRLFAMFHELAHYFLHAGRSPAEAFYFGLLQSPEEMEADAFATIALIPRHKIGDYDFLDDHPNKFARKIFKDRGRLEFLYDI